MPAAYRSQKYKTLNILETEIATNGKTTLQDELKALRRHFHTYPELSWGEYETSRTLIEHLREMGLDVATGLAQTGFYVDIDSGNSGPTIAWRADMDALPIQDEKKVSYASKVEGISHMCGHDVHSTVAFGIVRKLIDDRDSFRGRIRVFWQPAEEQQPSGSPDMIRDGVLDGVEAVYGMHCDPHTESGKISLRPGAETAAFDAFQFEIDSGSTQHSARPHKGPDAMWVGNQLVHHLYQFAGRMTDALEPTVVSVCMFKGGNALNVIPRKVSIGGTIRTVSENKREIMRKHIQNLAQSLGLLHNVEIKTDFGLGAPAVMNNEAIYDFAVRELKSRYGDDAVIGRDQSMGAEDFSFYTVERPGLFIRVGTSSGPDTSHPLHSSLFDIDERILEPTAEMAAFLLRRHTLTEIRY